MVVGKTVVYDKVFAPEECSIEQMIEFLLKFKEEHKDVLGKVLVAPVVDYNGNSSIVVEFIRLETDEEIKQRLKILQDQESIKKEAAEKKKKKEYQTYLKLKNKYEKQTS